VDGAPPAPRGLSRPRALRRRTRCVRNDHCHGGSDTLAALLEVDADRGRSPLHWTPNDLDVFALCRSDTERSDEFFHFTPFVHAAFGFSVPFYSDEALAALRQGGGQLPQDGRMEERLECVRERPGYDELPVWRRTYRLATHEAEKRRRRWQRMLHPALGIPASSDHDDDDEEDNALVCFTEAASTGDEDDAPGDEKRAAWRPASCSPKGAQFQIIMVRRALGPEVNAELERYLPVPAVAALVAEYGGRDGHASLSAFFDARRELPFCNVLFDGRRFRVQDWNSIWQRAATVRGGPEAMRADEPSADAARKWARLLDRIGKYRERGFRIDLVDLDTSALRRPAGLHNWHLSRRCRRAQRPRRASTFERGQSAPDFPWDYPPGLFCYERERWPEDWRPTYRLRQQTAAARREREAKRASGPFRIVADRWFGHKPPGIDSAPSTPRATRARRELHGAHFIAWRRELHVEHRNDTV
jgi:hypothetical protein